MSRPANGDGRPPGSPGNCRWPQITIEIAARLGERVAKGLPLVDAIALEPRTFPEHHFQKALEARPQIRAVYARKQAEWQLDAVQKIATYPKLPVGLCWLSERRRPGYYAVPKGGSGTTVNVQVNTMVGLPDDVMRRAAALVERSPKVKQLSSSNVKVETK